MPENKDLKRLVRDRMRKTGEAYTAARAQIVRKPRATNGTKPEPSSAAPPKATSPKTAPPKAEQPAPDYAKIAGMSDAAIEAKTGCTWERWVHALDYHKAYELTHKEIAQLVGEKFGVGPWWRQSVTVGYERIKGLRVRGQRRNGTYEASKSRTFAVPVDRLFDMWANARLRRQWLNGATVRVRTATPPKSLRLDWNGEGIADGIVEVWLTAKGPGKSCVAVQQTKLPDRAAVERAKQYWSERFDALAEAITA